MCPNKSIVDISLYNLFLGKGFKYKFGHSILDRRMIGKLSIIPRPVVEWRDDESVTSFY